jgi:signal recognition particle subunit SEC65
VRVLGDVAENAVWEPVLAQAAAKSSGRRVRGSFCVLTPEMAEIDVVANRLKLWWAGARTYDHLPEG